MRRLATLLALALVWPLAWAQNDLDDALFGGGAETSQQADTEAGKGDDIFSGQDSFVTETAEDANANPAADLLTSETVTLGGSFSLDAQLALALYSEENEDAFTSGLVDLKTRLFVDARPTQDFRAFVKGDIAYSTTDDVTFDLREAFADLSVADTVFVRAGKQTVN